MGALLQNCGQCLRSLMKTAANRTYATLSGPCNLQNIWLPLPTLQCAVGARRRHSFSSRTLSAVSSAVISSHDRHQAIVGREKCFMVSALLLSRALFYPDCSVAAVPLGPQVVNPPLGVCGRAHASPAWEGSRGWCPTVTRLELE